MKPFDPRLLRYSRSSRGFILLSVLLALLHAIATIAQGYVLARLIFGLFQEERKLTQFGPQVFTLFEIFLARAAIAYVTHVVAGYFSGKIKGELRHSIVNQVLDGDNTVIRNYGTARLSLLLTRGINYLDSYFSKFIPQLFIATFVPILVGITILREDWRSGVIVLFTIPLIPLFGILIGRFTAVSTQAKLSTLNFLNGYFLDLLNGLATLKVYHRSKIQTEKLREIGNKYRTETMKVLRISFLSSLALELVATLSVALLAVSIGIRLVNADVTLRSGLLILILAPEVYWPIRQVSALFHAAEDGVAAADEIFSILESQHDKGEIEITSFTAISWSDLTVRYSGRTEVFIPAAQLRPGKIYALVGPSGSGKSTLLSVLLGFTEVASGNIVISTEKGDIALSDVNKDSWRSLIAWMPQDPHFRFGRIKDLIGSQSLGSVGLRENELPSGLDTEVGGIHDQLSFGQKRRIALLRAIEKKSLLALFDEPTASVDDVTEGEILDVLQRLAEENRIVVVSSHRPITQSISSEQIVIGAL